MGFVKSLAGDLTFWFVGGICLPKIGNALKIIVYCKVFVHFDSIYVKGARVFYEIQVDGYFG